MIRTAIFAVGLLLSCAASAAAQANDDATWYARGEAALFSAARRDARELTIAPCGAPIRIVEQVEEAPYVHGVYGEYHGFLRRESLAPEPPICPVQLSDAALRAIRTASDALIDGLVAEFNRNAALVGPCKCPGDRALDGSRCGRRSAYIRLGGDLALQCRSSPPSP